MKMKKRRLFFSGNAGTELSSFSRENDWDLVSQSLIRFESVPFEITQPFDVVFISSKRSYDYFISQINSSNSFDYAIIGAQTSKHLNVQNSWIKFIGSNPGKPEEVAQEFKDWLGDRRVLFPVSKRSQQTIAKVIPATQKEVVYCYDTLLVKAEIPPHDLYVFTSPSNAEAFLQENTFPENSAVIAWGTTTANYLRSVGNQPLVTMEQSSEAELIAVLRSLAV